MRRIANRTHKKHNALQYWNTSEQIIILDSWTQSNLKVQYIEKVTPIKTLYEHPLNWEKRMGNMHQNIWKTTYFLALLQANNPISSGTKTKIQAYLIGFV